MSTIANLSAQLSLNHSAYQRGLSQAAAQAAAAGKKIADSLNVKHPTIKIKDLNAPRVNLPNLTPPKTPTVPQYPRGASTPWFPPKPPAGPPSPFGPIYQTGAASPWHPQMSPKFVGTTQPLTVPTAPQVPVPKPLKKQPFGKSYPTGASSPWMPQMSPKFVGPPLPMAMPAHNAPATPSPPANAAKNAAAAGKNAGNAMNNAGNAAKNMGNAATNAANKAAKALNNTGNAAKGVAKNAKGITSVFSGMGNTVGSALGFSEAGLMGLSRAALTASAAIAAVVSAIQGLRLAATTEMATVSFETITGSAQEAFGIVKDIKDMAARTPYTSPELIQAGRHLMAMGIQGRNLMDTLTALGNIASVSGGDLEGLAEAYGKAAARGEVNGRTLEQFARRGVNLREAIAKVFDVTALEAEQLVTEGKVGFNEFRAAIETLVNEGGRFNGGMLRASKTIEGLGSTIYDNLILTLEYAATVFIKTFNIHGVMKSAVAATGWLQSAVLELTEYTDLLRLFSFTDVWIAAFGAAKEAVVALFREFRPEIEWAKQAIKDFGKMMMDELVNKHLPYLRKALLNAFEVLGVAGAYVVDAMYAAGAAVQVLIKNVKDMVRTTTAAVSAILQTTATAATIANPVLAGKLVSAINDIDKAIKAMMESGDDGFLKGVMQDIDLALRSVGIGQSADRVREAFRKIREGVVSDTEEIKEHLDLGREGDDILRAFGETAKRIKEINIGGLGDLDQFKVRLQETRDELKKAGVELPEGELFKIVGGKMQVGRDLAKELQKELEVRRAEFMKMRVPVAFETDAAKAAAEAGQGISEQLAAAKKELDKKVIVSGKVGLKMPGVIQGEAKFDPLKKEQDAIKKTRQDLLRAEIDFKQSEIGLIKRIELMRKLGQVVDPLSEDLQKAIAEMKFKLIEESLEPIDIFVSKFETLDYALKNGLDAALAQEGIRKIGEEFVSATDKMDKFKTAGKSILGEQAVKAEELRNALLKMAKAGKFGDIGTAELEPLELPFKPLRIQDVFPVAGAGHFKPMQLPTDPLGVKGNNPIEWLNEMKPIELPIAPLEFPDAPTRKELEKVQELKRAWDDALSGKGADFAGFNTLDSLRSAVEELEKSSRNEGFLNMLKAMKAGLDAIDASVVEKLKEFSGKIIADQVDPLQKFMQQAAQLQKAADTMVDGKPLLNEDQLDLGIAAAMEELNKAMETSRGKLLPEAMAFGSQEEASFRNQLVAQVEASGVSHQQRLENYLKELNQKQQENITVGREVRDSIKRLNEKLVVK